VLLLTYLLVFAGLAVLLFAGTAWFQGYIYSEPAEELYWRAPAAAGALTLFLAFWGFLAYRSPGDYPAMFQLTSEGKPKEFDKMKAVYGDEKIEELRRAPGRRGRDSYVDAQGNPMKTRPFAVIVEEDGEQVRFDAERDGKFFKPRDGTLHYKDSRGRVMTEDALGFLPTSRLGLFWGNVLLNLVHFGVWFVCCWLLLQYQWSHALGVAAVLWLIMTFSVAEMLVQRVERAKKERLQADSVASWLQERMPLAERTPYSMWITSPSCTT
jgi:hypothetical protein